MKRNILFLILGISAVTAVTVSCGRDAADRTVSGGAVSGYAAENASASGTVVRTGENGSPSEETDITKLRYANDRNIFEGDKDRGVYQYDLTGKEECYYDLDLELRGKELSFTDPEVLWVDNDWVFISCHGYDEDYGEDGEYYEIWRIPVVQKDEKRHLDIKSGENLVKVERLYALITKTDREIFYCADEKICRLDLQTKKVQQMDTGIQEFDIQIVRDANGIPFVQDGKAYYNDNMEGRMYQVDLEKWKIVRKGPYSDGTMVSDGASLYFRTEGLIRYDSATGKKKTLISEEKLTEKIEGIDIPQVKTGKKKKRGPVMDDYIIKSIYHREDRLYLAVEVSFESSGSDDEDDSGDYGELMLSCLASDGSGLRYEKVLTEYLWEHSTPYTDSYAETLWGELTGDFSKYMGDCIVMHFYNEELPDETGEEDEEEHHRFAVYDLRDGAFREMDKPSAEYGYIKALGYSFYERSHC